MKLPLLSLLLAGLFAGVGISAIAEDVKPVTEPKPGSSAAPVESDATGQRPPLSPKRTEPAKEGSAPPAKDSAGDSSDQPKKTKDY